MGPVPFIQTISSTDKTSSGLLDGTGKQMLNLVASSGTQTLARFSQRARRDPLRHLD